HGHRAGLRVALLDVRLRRVDAELGRLGLDDWQGELTENRLLLEPAADGLAVRPALSLNATDADEVSPGRSEEHVASLMAGLDGDEVDSAVGLVPRHRLSGERVELPLIAQIGTQALWAALRGVPAHLAQRPLSLLLLARQVRQSHQ